MGTRTMGTRTCQGHPGMLSVLEEATGMRPAQGCRRLGDCHQALLLESSPAEAEGCQKATRHQNKVPLRPHPAQGSRWWDPKRIAAIECCQRFGQGIIFPCPSVPAPGHPRGWEMGTGTMLRPWGPPVLAGAVPGTSRARWAFCLLFCYFCLIFPTSMNPAQFPQARQRATPW